jgi:OmpA-OmpF porin, OOP family
MYLPSKKFPAAVLLAATCMSLPALAFAQETNPRDNITVTGTQQAPETVPNTAGPELKGIISARSGDRIWVASPDGKISPVAITDATRITSSSGILGIGRARLSAKNLLNGLPVTIRTLQSSAGTGDLTASRITFRGSDLKTASMIHNGTDQRFNEQTAATAELRGRVGDIDNYNVKATTNVNFDTGRAVLSEEAKARLCATAQQAEATSNALLLVVGYTDSTGSEDYNQTLSEKRAAKVINYLQQACHWKPYRVLTPAGMAEADPLADNSTPEGKAQNRRVAVNVLVSKAVDGIETASAR